MILDKFRLDNKVASVTGASRGIGRAIAVALAEAGANTVPVARDISKLNELAEELSSRNLKCIPYKADLSSVSNIKQMVDFVKKECGRIDILVNNAAVNVRKPAFSVTEDDWEKQMAVNMKGLFFTAQQAAMVMKEQAEGGKIINIDSTGSVIGLENQIMYCGTKGGVSQMTKAMAVEWAKYNIYVTAIGPGLTKTSLTERVFTDKELLNKRLQSIPLRRTAVPEDMQGVAVFLASEASNYITGHTIYVDGGWVIS